MRNNSFLREAVSCGISPTGRDRVSVVSAFGKVGVMYTAKGPGELAEGRGLRVREDKERCSERKNTASGLALPLGVHGAGLISFPQEKSQLLWQSAMHHYPRWAALSSCP